MFQTGEVGFRPVIVTCQRIPGHLITPSHPSLISNNTSRFFALPYPGRSRPPTIFATSSSGTVQENDSDLRQATNRIPPRLHHYQSAPIDYCYNLWTMYGSCTRGSLEDHPRRIYRRRLTV